MKRWLIAAGFAAAVLAQGAVPALAADLGDRYEPRQGSAYDDPRYADLYGRPTPPPPRYSYQPPIPSAPVYRDHGRDVGDAYVPPHQRRYSESHPRDEYRQNEHRQSNHCAPKDEIQRQLVRQGWEDFHAPEVIDRDTAFVKARRPSGRLFEIKIDRCSGDILAARPLQPREPRGYGPNTYGEYRPSFRPGWGRTY